jgi:hypothetical protein
MSNESVILFTLGSRNITLRTLLLLYSFRAGVKLGKDKRLMVYKNNSLWHNRDTVKCRMRIYKLINFIT